MERVNDIPYGPEPWQVLDLYWKSGCPLPAPLIISIHGGSWISGDEDSGPTLETSLSFVEHGYAVASIRYRLDGLYDEKINDVVLAANYLRIFTNLFDLSKIFLFGTSAGGNMVLYAMLKGLIGCAGVVNICGPTNLTKLPIVRACRPDLMDLVFGSNDDQFLLSKSPISLVKSGLPPVLMIHGVSDPLVPISTAYDFYIAMRNQGNRIEALTTYHADPLFGHDPLLGIFPDKNEIFAKIYNFVSSI